MKASSDSNYPVGYGKPPRHTQFKPGQSGNVHGRPKKTLTVAEALKKELFATATIVKKNGKTKKISMLEAMFKRLVFLAAEGDPKATSMLLKLLALLDLNEENKIVELLQAFRARDEEYEAAAADSRPATTAVEGSAGVTNDTEEQHGSL